MTAGEPALSFLRGGGRLGELIATFDWSGTALGPIDGWPPHVEDADGTDAALGRADRDALGRARGDDLQRRIFAVRRRPSSAPARTNVREAWDEVADFNDNVMRVGLAGGT
jgi:hypothetical protein